MPFDDELAGAGVEVVAYRESWVVEAAVLARTLGRSLTGALAVEHIGSTAVPGMAAKNCLDMMIVVEDLSASQVGPELTGLGYRQRPEPWNTAEPAAGQDWPKLVFAPPLVRER